MTRRTHPQHLPLHDDGHLSQHLPPDDHRHPSHPGRPSSGELDSPGASSPYVKLSMQCAGPGCPAQTSVPIRWFVISLLPDGFFCHRFSNSALASLSAAQSPVCGPACAHRLFERYLHSLLRPSATQEKSDRGTISHACVRSQAPFASIKSPPAHGNKGSPTRTGGRGAPHRAARKPS